MTSRANKHNSLLRQSTPSRISKYSNDEDDDDDYTSDGSTLSDITEQQAPRNQSNNAPSPTRSAKTSSTVHTTKTSATTATSITRKPNKGENHSSRHGGNPHQPFCSEFGRTFDESVLPICIDQGTLGSSKRHIGWSCNILSLDYDYHLPLFISGLMETDPPYNFLAYEGTLDMIIVGGPRNRILPVIPKLIPALKLCLQSAHRPSVSKAMYVLLLIMKCDSVETGGLGAIGRAISPYLSRLLPTFNAYLSDKRKIGIEGAYQCAEQSLGDVAVEIMEACELRGEANVIKVIKLCVPTYSSVNLGL